MLGQVTSGVTMVGTRASEFRKSEFKSCFHWFHSRTLASLFNLSLRFISFKIGIMIAMSPKD